MNVQGQIEKRKRSVKRFFQAFFTLGFLLTLAGTAYMYLNQELSVYRAVLGSFASLIYFGLAFKGIDTGIDEIVSNLDFLEENPDILKLNIFPPIVFAVLLVLIIGSAPLLTFMPMAFILVVFLMLALFFIGVPLLSKSSQAAVVFYAIDPEISTLKAYMKALKLSKTLYGIYLYERLVQWATSSALGRKVLGLSSFPADLISPSLGNAALSYTEIVAVVENASALDSVVGSLQLTLDDPAETSFLDLGAKMVLIVLFLFLLFPAALSFGALILLQPISMFDLALAAVPFALGILVFLAMGSAVTASNQLALISNYASER